MSLFFRAKKYLASKFSESQTGQRVLRALFGWQGHTIMQSLVTASSRFYGEDRGRQFRVNLLKLILKLVLLYRNNVITPAAAASARPKVLAMLDMIIDALEADASERNDATVQALNKVMMACHDAVMPLLQPNVREHNWQRLTLVFEILASRDFLHALLFDHEYQIDRDTLLVNFKALLRPYENELSELKQFQHRMTLERVQHLESLISEPKVRMWIDDEQAVRLFQHWLREHMGPDALNQLLFIRAVHHFRGTNNRGLLQKRARQVVETYIQLDAQKLIHLEADLRESTIHKVRNGGRSRNMFDDAEAVTMDQLNNMFDTYFVHSEQFQILVREHSVLGSRASRHDRLSSIASQGTAEPVPEAGASELVLREISLEAAEDGHSDDERGEAAEEAY